MSGCPPATFVILFVRPFILDRYLVNGLKKLSETYSEYSLAPIDDLIIFCRSKVKVTTNRPLRSDLVNTIFHELL